MQSYVHLRVQVLQDSKVVQLFIQVSACQLLEPPFAVRKTLGTGRGSIEMYKRYKGHLPDPR
jgi:hypothetical protein